MNKLPSLDPGTVVRWQEIHRTVRASYAEQLVGRTIHYHTYVTIAAHLQPQKFVIESIELSRARSNGHDRVFLGTNAVGEPIQLPWNRIVEVIV